jgi:flagellar motor switch protein FliN/FliY
MGAASTALSDFLGYSVNISTPETFELKDMTTFKETHLPHEEWLVVVRFKLLIEDALESEFMNVMSADLAKKLLAGLGLDETDIGATGEAETPANSSTAQSTPEEPPVQAAPPQTPPPQEPAAETASSSGSGGKMSQEEIERMLASMNSAEEPEDTSQPAPAPAAAAPTPMPTPTPTPTPPPVTQPTSQSAAPPVSQPQAAPMPANQPAAQMPAAQPQMAQMPQMPQGAPNGYMGYPPMYYQPPMAAAPQPKVINTQPMPMQKFDATDALSEEQAQNLDLIMEVPLQVTVEIGRTRRKVQDILSFSKGALVVLDKLAGDQVDLLVNGKCIARGDVVVVEDNFGVRITEIMQNTTINDLVKK